MGFKKFNSKLETSLANTLLASMSDEGEEDHQDTSKRLDEEFAGSRKVRGTTRERIKTGITGAAAAQGFKTRGLELVATVCKVSAASHPHHAYECSRTMAALKMHALPAFVRVKLCGWRSTKRAVVD